ncbi:hypothetical protein AYX15_01923 [Cryptococcus neoformans]|nr:hypothetical protein AYX15_01923 [Cryptococcus neoformans var. grubii]
MRLSSSSSRSYTLSEPSFTFPVNYPLSTRISWADGVVRLDKKERLKQLDTMHRIVVEPYHLSVIHNHLSMVHSSGRRSAVLDIGTGTGQWAAMLANAEPFADVMALAPDWKSYTGERIHHGNLDFSSADITRPLPWPSSSFDVIQVKGLARTYKRYGVLLERLARLLRHGGLLVIVEHYMGYESSSGQILPLCLRQWDASIKTALAANVDSMMAARLGDCVRSAGVFGLSAYSQEIGVPVACYMPQNSPTLAEAGSLHSRILSSELRSFLPELVAYGYRRTDLEGMIEGCLDELLNPCSRYLQRLVALYAVKQ